MKNKKVAIITGASLGIGKAIALKLNKEGLITVLVSRNQKNLNNALKDFSDKAIAIKADVSKEKEVILMVKKVIKKFGRVDILINNAAFLMFKKIEQITRTDFNKMIGTNIGGVFYCMRECVKQMKKQSKGGQIINIGSLVSKTPFLFPTRSLYCSTKSAINAFANSIQAEMQIEKNNIKIATIHPGLIFTESSINKNAFNYKDLSKYALKIKDIAYIIQMIINQGKNSNITEVVISPIARIRNKKFLK